MQIKLSYKLFLLLVLSFVVGLSNPSMVDAAEKKDKSARKAALILQKMKQDMEAEKTAMQIQFDTQKKVFEDQLKLKENDLNQSIKQLDESVRKAKILSTVLAKTKDEKVAVETKLVATQINLEATQKNLADTTAQLKKANEDLSFNDNQRKTQSSNLAQTTKQVNECVEKNAKLHQFGTELIQIYDKPDRYNAAMRKENFFQLKRVELENLLQNQQDKLDDAKFTNRKQAY